MQKGLVIVSHSSEVVVEDTNGALYTCKLRRKNRRPVCGDRVLFDPDQHCIEKIEPRSSELSRPDSYRKIKPLAANIDRFFIVCAVEPDIDFGLIDRYLVAASVSNCSAVIVLNKCDLLQELNDPFHDLGYYEKIGYPLLKISAKNADDIIHMAEAFNHHTSILVGQSGVGKSSIIKSLLPGIDIRIGELSEATGSGCHTTTTTNLYHLSNGGDLIDSPGVRAFRLWNLQFEQIEAGFSEFRPLLGQCRFHNCRHIDEPGCAIKNAVEAGTVSPRRYESFRIIVDSLES